MQGSVQLAQVNSQPTPHSGKAAQPHSPVQPKHSPAQPQLTLLPFVQLPVCGKIELSATTSLSLRLPLRLAAVIRFLLPAPQHPSYLLLQLFALLLHRMLSVLLPPAQLHFAPLRCDADSLASGSAAVDCTQLMVVALYPPLHLPNNRMSICRATAAAAGLHHSLQTSLSLLVVFITAGCNLHRHRSLLYPIQTFDSASVHCLPL